jgi:hypothetical protein
LLLFQLEIQTLSVKSHSSFNVLDLISYRYAAECRFLLVA